MLVNTKKETKQNDLTDTDFKLRNSQCKGPETQNEFDLLKEEKGGQCGKRWETREESR